MGGEFGDIDDRVGIVASADLLADAKELLIIDRWSEQAMMPKNRGTTMNWRRYLNLSTAISPIVGSNTPDGQELQFDNIVTQIQEFGSWIPISDRIMNVHEDPILNQAQLKSSFQMALSLETLNFNTAKVGLSVKIVSVDGLGVDRSDVDAVVTRADFRAAIRVLENNDAAPFTSLIRSTPDFDTHGIESAYFAYAHTTLAPAFRAMPGFLSVSEYSSRQEPLPGEIGNLENVRIVLSNVAVPFIGAGDTAGTNVFKTGCNVDVYPIIICAKDAYGCIPLRGAGAIHPTVLNPGVPSKSDPLGQRGFVGWKTWFVCVVLNQAWMVRMEIGATDLNGVS